MTSPYLPLPPDSDDDNDNVPMSDDEEPESPEGYPYVPIVADSDTEESDPEEDTEDNSWENDDTNIAPSSSAPMYSFEVPAPTRQTARQRVAMPQRVTLSPDHTVPTIDHTDNSQSWEQTLDTLRRWRSIGRNHSTYEQGETSEQREPLLDTTPIIVNRMLSHEHRMDLLEDVIIHVPEPEAYAMLEDHVVSAEEDVSGIREEVRKLTAKLESINMTVKGMESTMEKLIWRSHQTQLREIISFESEVYAMKGRHKKDEN